MFDWDDDEMWRLRGKMSGREAPRHNRSHHGSGYRGGHSGRSWSKHGSRPGIHTTSPHRYSQRAVVQTHLKYADSSGSTGTARHLTYIQRDGAGRDDESPALFGPDDTEVGRADFIERSRDDDHQFRIILSPDRGHDLELEDYTREWMGQVENDLDQPLDWAAAVHHNTDSPHAHIVIRGRDREGERVFISPDYMNRGLRHRAREVATHHLGPRTPSEMQRAHERQTAMEHYTELDGALLSARNERDEVHLDKLDLDSPGLRRNHLRERLHHLKSLGLARRDRDAWRLHPQLSDRLDALARQKDILRRLRDADRAEPDRWSDSLPTDRLIGRVVDRGVADELEDQPYLVVDGEDGRTRYIEPGSADLPNRHDLVVMRKRGDDIDAKTLDEQDLDRAVHADGPTWLDRRLVSNTRFPDTSRLGQQIADATERRRLQLTRRGLLAENARPPRDLIKRLRADERERYAASLAEREGRSVCRLPEDRRRIEGDLGERISLRGGDVYVVRNDTELAVVPADKYLDQHSQVRVRIERSKNANGRLRTYVTAQPNPSRSR